MHFTTNVCQQRHSNCVKLNADSVIDLALNWDCHEGLWGMGRKSYAISNHHIYSKTASSVTQTWISKKFGCKGDGELQIAKLTNFVGNCLNRFRKHLKSFKYFVFAVCKPMGWKDFYPSSVRSQLTVHRVTILFFGGKTYVYCTFGKRDFLEDVCCSSRPHKAPSVFYR